MEPMRHVEVPYPSVEQGAHSLSHLARAAIGQETLSTPDIAAHSWVATGGALSQLLPPDGPMAAKIMTFTPEQRAALNEFATMRAGDMEKLDWSKAAALLKVLLPLLLSLLGCFLFLFLLVGTALAAAPPQSTLPVADSAPQSTLAVVPADSFADASKKIARAGAGEEQTADAPQATLPAATGPSYFTTTYADGTTCACGCIQTGKCICPNCNAPAKTTATVAPALTATNNPWRYDASRNILWRYGSEMPREQMPVGQPTTGTTVWTCSNGTCTPVTTYGGDQTYYTGYGSGAMFGAGGGGCAGGSCGGSGGGRVGLFGRRR